MNRPNPALPTSRRDHQGQACVKSLMGIKRRTGVTMPKHLILKMAFDSGYEAGAEDAACGELLAEAQSNGSGRNVRTFGVQLSFGAGWGGAFAGGLFCFAGMG